MNKFIRLKTGECYWVTDKELKSISSFCEKEKGLGFINIPSIEKSISGDVIHSFGTPDFLLVNKVEDYELAISDSHIIDDSSNVYVKKDNKWIKLHKGKWRNVDIFDLENIKKLKNE